MRQKQARGEVPPGPGTGTHQGAGPSAPPSSPPRGGDVNTQLAQARELEAKLAEEYRAVRLLRASIAGEASACGERARELGRQARVASTPTSTSAIGARPRERARSSLPLRRCYGPCPPLDAQGAEPAPRGAGAYRASGRPIGRKLGVPHPPAGEHVGRRGRARPRALGAHGRRSGASRQPGAHADQGAAPRHARASPRWRRPQRHQRPANGQHGDAGNGRLPPSTGWALR
jgi:hypothetical protein